jgi:hypothetical protein
MVVLAGINMALDSETQNGYQKARSWQTATLLKPFFKRYYNEKRDFKISQFFE